MARRLALLTLMACAVVARRPPPHSSDVSISESDDPYFDWDEYEDSYEVNTPDPRIHSTTTRAKVILRSKIPRVNVTMLNTKGEDKKKVIKTTNINIHSHTNFIMTKSPIIKHEFVTSRPMVQIEHHYVWLDDPLEEEEEEAVATSSRRPATKATTTTRKPSTTRRPATTRRPPTTRNPAPTTRRPAPTRRTITTRRPSTTSRRPIRTTKKQKIQYTRRTTSRPPKDPDWLSSFFRDNNNLRREPKRPERTGSFLGFFSRIFGWFSRSAWLGNGGWFEDSESSKYPSDYTTSPPQQITSQSSWFQTLLETEDNDGAHVNDPNTVKKSEKKIDKKNYAGYQLLRTYPDSQWKVREMLDLQEDAQGSGVTWWTSPTMTSSTDILVPPDLLHDVKDQLKSANIDFDVVIWDLQKAITYENPRLSKKQRLELEQLRGHPMTWRRYHRYADILRYLEYLQHSYSDIVELVPLGRSSEGLPLVAVKVSVPSNETQAKDANNKGKKKWKLRSHMKPAVWIDGGSHAREWIAPAVATWMIHTLVEGEKGLGAELDLLRQADFYIMPVLNPDGYEYSHTHDRLWSKTRSQPPDQSDDYYVGWFSWYWDKSDCIGVDTDRNWDFHWGEQDSSKDPCADNYAGPHPFSEPETRAVSNFLNEHRGQIKVFLSLHAYSQAWLLPSSHSLAPFADDGVMMEMGKLATTALSDMYGTRYQIGTAADLRQPASGMPHDWAKARAGIKFAYQVELRDSFGPYGFLLPGSQIVSTARETWQAVKAIVDNLTPEVEG